MRDTGVKEVFIMKDIIENTAQVPNELVNDSLTIDGHLTAYEYFIKACAVEKSKAPSTLADILKQPENVRLFTLGNYAYSVFKRVVSNGDVRIKTDARNMLIVNGDVIAPIVCMNNHLTTDQITQVNVFQIVAGFPAISVILTDIQKEKANNVPQLPNAVIEITKRVFKAPAKDEDYILATISRERLAFVLMTVWYHKKDVNMDYNRAVLHDLSKQIKSHIIKNKLVKETLPKNSEIGIEAVLIDEIEKRADYDLKKADNQMKAFGF